jgi:hypothetical protein
MAAYFSCRLNETVNILIPGEELHYVEWSNTQDRPQVVEPGIENPRIYGTEEVTKWLRELSVDVTFWIDPIRKKQEKN